MPDTYRWGILAPGKIAHKFATGLQFVPEAKLHAIGSRDIDRARDFADQYQAPVWYGSYQELAEDPDIDVIYIATPHSFHMENTLTCLEQGKAVLCEKPLAINSSQVETMIMASKNHQSFLMEALWSRFLPNIIRVRNLIESGAIGAVSHLEADFGFKAPYDPKSRLFNPNLGGGALLDIGIYPLFFATYLFGTPETIESSAKFADTGVDESCSVKLTFSGGKQANLMFTISEFTAVKARITGDNGEIMLPNRWYQPVNVITNAGNDPQEEVIKFVGNGYNYQVHEVHQCLDKGKIESDHWSHRHSLQLMQLMDEIRRQCGISYAVDR
ncbi:MAG: dehydrogenase [Cyclobacteriaceae bacterium]|nr:MAG: dehydrogenase [Cyclobacteriaceae bacterium]